MLGDFENESVLSTLNFKSVKNFRKVSLELDIDDGTDDLRDLSNCDLRGEGPLGNKLGKHLTRSL
jgi:hypothetical protein